MEELDAENLGEIDQVLDELLDQMPGDRKSVLMQEAEMSSSSEAEELLSDIAKETSEPSFAAVLEEEELSQSENEHEALLTEEERSFFFDQRQEETVEENHFEQDFMEQPKVDVQSLDENQEIYEDLILSPVLKDTHRLYLFISGLMGVTLFFIFFLCYMQSQTHDMLLQNRVLMQLTQKASSKSSFLDKGIVQQRQEILSKLNSALSTREEKALCNFFLASFAYQEGDMKAGRKYMLEGAKLRNDK